MHRALTLTLALVSLVLTLTPGWAAAPETIAHTAGPVTNLPVPRFVSLKRSEVYMRRGPGADHPIVWTYQRKNLPVEITNEFEQWRKVRDIDGAEGWISANMLAGEPRYGVVRATTGKAARAAPKRPADGWPMRRRPDVKAKIVAILEPGVVAEVRHCPNEWCEVKAGKARGWIERAALWGVYPDEVIR